MNRRNLLRLGAAAPFTPALGSYAANAAANATLKAQ